MIWLAIAVLFVLVIFLWLKLTEVRSWATKTSAWLNKHYLHHLAYHEDWESGPTGPGEGGPPPFP